MAGVNFDWSYLPAQNYSASQVCGKALAYRSWYPTPKRSVFFFFFFFFFLYHAFIFTVQELACSASYGVNKTSISKHNNKGKTIAFHLQVCQILDTSANIRLTKESKNPLKAKQPF